MIKKYLWLIAIAFNVSLIVGIYFFTVYEPPYTTPIFDDNPKDAETPLTIPNTNSHFGGASEIDTAYQAPIESKIWKDLLDIKYESSGAYGYLPNFTSKHKAWHNKTIELEGYMYPLDNEKIQKFFMLSYFPIQTCFFCGGAGPESIVEINSPKGIALQSQRIKLKGKLRLNTEEPERLFYILDDAIKVE